MLRTSALCACLVVSACSESLPPLPDRATRDAAVPVDRATTDGLTGVDGPLADRAVVDRRVPPDSFTCSPNTFVGCATTTQLTKCNAAGTGTLVVGCGAGKCDPTLKRCNECDPATFTTRCDAASDPALIVTCTPDGVLHKSACANAQPCRNYFFDTDGDTFGADSTVVSSCSMPAGKPGGSWVLDGGDCNDKVNSVNPKQTKFFDQPAPGGTLPYDYDCDGKEEPERTAVIAGCGLPPLCVKGGWLNSAPACGSKGTWVTCTPSGLACATATQVIPQACR